MAAENLYELLTADLAKGETAKADSAAFVAIDQQRTALKAKADASDADSKTAHQAANVGADPNVLYQVGPGGKLAMSIDGDVRYFDGPIVLAPPAPAPPVEPSPPPVDPATDPNAPPAA